MGSSGEFYHPDLEFLGEELDTLSVNDVENLVPLQPQLEGDPFYDAQLHQKNIQKLTGYSSSDVGPHSRIIGHHATEMLNHQHKSWTGRELAFRAFIDLKAIEHDPEPIPYEGSIMVAGVFEGFDFDTFKNSDTVIALLANPQFRRPGYLYDTNFSQLPIPVMAIDAWRLYKKLN